VTHPTLPRFLADVVLPKGLRKDSWRFARTFYLGEIAFFLMAILVVTGPLLMLRYTPTPEGAYGSVETITRRIPFGALIRGLHRAASYAILVVLLLHLLRIFYQAAYKGGRALGWHSGIALLLLTAAQSYTGYLLPWDQTGYWGTVVGASIASYVPLIGERLERFLIGGDEVGAQTLLRFYVGHVVLVPGAIVAILSVHFYSLRKAGLSRPDGGAREGTAAGASGGARGGDAPEHSPAEVALKMAALFFATLLATLVAGALLPIALEPAADPGTPPNPARAAWFARGLQELVHYSAFWGGIVTPGLLVALLASLPYVDRGEGRRLAERRGIVLAGTALLVVFLALTVIGNFFRGPAWAWRWPWAG
jgi:quinol-cytochrome oxidoreductase complex cytochrome b subunit